MGCVAVWWSDYYGWEAVPWNEARKVCAIGNDSRSLGNYGTAC
jgi:hypothetical protein